MKKVYLITWSHYSGSAINHGLVSINNQGLVNGETPVEDFGMFFYREEPFPEDEKAIAQIFLDLMDEEAFGLDDTIEGKTVREHLQTEEGTRRMINKDIYGFDFSNEARRAIYK